MFNENLKSLRRQKQMTQETLAVSLHVTRQTISKWEKGISVPDADTLVRIAEILEVSVSSLLGGKIEDECDKDSVAGYLAQIAELLAEKNRRTKLIIKVIICIVASIAAIFVLFAITFLIIVLIRMQQ